MRIIRGVGIARICLIVRIGRAGSVGEIEAVGKVSQQSDPDTHQQEKRYESDKRFIRIENKFTEGKLLLIVENSKTGERNESLKTTKRDNYSHGRGIHSVRKVVEKYNGTVTFTDKGAIFEVSVMLYGIEAKK